MDLTHPQADRSAVERRIYWGAKGVALAAATLSLTVVMLLAASWLTAGRARPSDSPALTKLVRQVGGDPRNPELREQVRELDVLARQAYLSSVAFRKRGAVLLLATLVVMAGSLKLMSGTGKMVPKAAMRDDDSPDVRVMASAAVCCFLAFLGGLVYVYSQERPLPAGLATVAPRPAGTLTPATPAPAAPRPTAPHAPVVPAATPATNNEHLAELYWPALRGWRGLGVGSKQVPPTGWDGRTGSNIIWKTKIPLTGHNSPVVWDQRVFVSGADEKQRAVYAFDARTGALLWQVAVQVPEGPTEAPEVSSETGYAAPTMACDSRYAYALFANGDLVCVDHAGRVVWSQSLGVAKISYGYASSLLAYEGRLFVQRDIGEDSVVLALDGATGAELWRAPRDAASAWCSPVIALRKGVPVLVVNGVGSIVAYAMETGESLWRAEGLAGEIAPSPASGDGLVLVTMAGSGCLAIHADDGSKAWANEDVDAPEITSPVMAGGLAFILSDNGVLTCLQAATGALLWKHEFDGTFSASPVIAAGRLYITDTTGQTHVLKAAGSFQSEANGRLGEACHATPAASGNRLYLRGSASLFCVGDAPK